MVKGRVGDGAVLRASEIAFSTPRFYLFSAFLENKTLDPRKQNLELRKNRCSRLFVFQKENFSRWRCDMG